MGGKIAQMLNELMENVERGAPRTRQTAATDVFMFSKLLWLEFGAFLVFSKLPWLEFGAF